VIRPEGITLKRDDRFVELLGWRLAVLHLALREADVLEERWTLKRTNAFKANYEGIREIDRAITEIQENRFSLRQAFHLLVKLLSVPQIYPWESALKSSVATLTTTAWGAEVAIHVRAILLDRAGMKTWNHEAVALLQSRDFPVFWPGRRGADG